MARATGPDELAIFSVILVFVVYGLEVRVALAIAPLTGFTFLYHSWVSPRTGFMLVFGSGFVHPRRRSGYALLLPRMD